MPSCPTCKAQCQLIKYAGVKIEKCGRCGGHWLTQAALDEIVEQRGQHLTPAVQQQMLALAERNPQTKQLACPSCRVAMEKVPFRRWKELVLDECPRCADRWLAPGKLEQCQIYAQQLGAHPQVAAARNAAEEKAVKLMKANAQLDAHRESLEGRRGFWRVFRVVSRIFLGR